VRRPIGYSCGPVGRPKRPLKSCTDRIPIGKFFKLTFFIYTRRAFGKARRPFGQAWFAQCARGYKMRDAPFQMRDARFQMSDAPQQKRVADC
jgi:hypothetical protein